MHDVSLRAASNRMDAHNLAVVLCPNLVASKTNPARDVMMCSVPGAPALFTRTPSDRPPASNPAALSEGKTTLGTVLKLCIQRYFEVFDELRDRAEAQPPLRAPGESSSSSSASSNSGFRASSPRRQSVRSALSQNEDEDIDDEMLVMPIGMEYSNGGTGQNGNGGAGPPSAWGAAGAGNGSNSTFRPRHRSNVSGAASTTGYGARSVMSNGGGVYGSTRTKSLVSVEKGSGVAGTGTVGRKGSIAVGRGTTRKASGAAVEAVGITASGFFSAPVNSTGRSPGP